MRPTKLEYRRVYNLGNYESATLGVEVELDEGESAVTTFPKLKLGVDEAYERLHGTKSLGRIGKESGLTVTQTLNKELDKK
jgi:hypothetical protein